MRRLLFFVALAIGLLGLLAAPALASPKTFYVHPSGGNDTANIQAAFNAAVKAGPGSTVQLSAGHFYTNTILVKDFHGTFRGAGEGKTFIDSLHGLGPSAAGRDPLTPAIEPFPFLFGFEGGHVRVSDMTSTSPPFSPAGPGANGGTDDSEDDLLRDRQRHSAFDRVAFTGRRRRLTRLQRRQGIIHRRQGAADANGNRYALADQRQPTASRAAPSGTSGIGAQVDRAADGRRQRQRSRTSSM